MFSCMLVYAGGRASSPYAQSLLVQHQPGNPCAEISPLNHSSTHCNKLRTVQPFILKLNCFRQGTLKSVCDRIWQCKKWRRALVQGQGTRFCCRKSKDHHVIYQNGWRTTPSVWRWWRKRRKRPGKRRSFCFNNRGKVAQIARVFGTSTYLQYPLPSREFNRF